MSLLFRISLGLGWILLANQLHGEVLLSDSFDYPDGPLTVLSSGRWQTHSGVAGQTGVRSGSVLLSETASEDVSALLKAGPYLASSGAKLYAGITIRFTGLPGSGGTYFAHFKDAGTLFRGKLFATTSGAAPGKVRLGISDSANGPSAILPTNLELNADYRVVLRYIVADAATTLWVNPFEESDSSATATDNASAEPIAAFAFRQSAVNGGMGELVLDDLVVATTFDEVLTGTSPPASVPGFSLLTYNVNGNNATDWSTNSPQVRAVGRQIQHLDPDVVTFQEIPFDLSWEMTNFVTAFRPGYHLAANSGTDGYIRGVILSRYPILRSQSWLDGAWLGRYGYNGRFTRDLFEAEIDVPGFPDPVHVFTTHLKAGTDAEATARKAAEASAISNFFVVNFIPGKGQRPYVLTGDLNEDIANPPATSLQPIQRLISKPTDLRLTSPVNPVNSSQETWAVWNPWGKRYDYILPGGLLWSNTTSSQVFRSDVLQPPPPPLLSGDSKTASDHVPVMMTFQNPFALEPFRILSLVVTNEQVRLTWESQPGIAYLVEASASPLNWTIVASNFVATGTNLTYEATLDTDGRFYRVVRQN